MSDTPAITVPVLDSDLIQHIEDTPLFMIIRDHHFVELPWNFLTDEERHAIYVNVFSPCGF